MTEIEAAWLAGLFEGEGNISWAHTNSVQLRLAMVDRDVVERVQRVAGYGSIIEMPPPKSKPHWQTKYRWVVAHKQEAQRLLELMLPHFGERRGDRAREALVRLSRAQNHPRRLQ